MALWRVAQAFLHVLHTLFGAPEIVAFRHTLTREAHGVLASWLRCAEAMLRQVSDGRRTIETTSARHARPAPHLGTRD